jgi:hypothetical protein
MTERVEMELLERLSGFLDRRAQSFGKPTPIMPGDAGRAMRVSPRAAAAALRQLGWRKGDAAGRICYFPPKN